MTRLRKRFLDCKGMSMEESTLLGTELAEFQRDIMFWIADLARYAKARWPETHQQIWPEWVSPGMIDRACGVGNSYPLESERQHEATYSQYMQSAGRVDRQARLAAIVDQGLTTDESRAASKQEHGDSSSHRYLLCVDLSYWLHRTWFSGAGIEAASGVASWIRRTVDRLREKGLTDCVCCLDSSTNHRKELTKDWEDKYKDRPPRDPELAHQLNLVRELLTADGFACVGVDGYEADDVMASYAKQFPGRVTLLSQDKDCRQLLSKKCNMLLDVEWKEDEHSGDMLPDYKWLSAAKHTEATGIPPERWVEYQCLRGDPTDGIRGCEGIGEKGSKDLVQWFGTAEGAIQAAKESDPRIKESKRLSLIEFESKLDVTRKLVTLRTDLELPTTTRL